MRLIPVVDDTEYYWSGGRRERAESKRARSREWQRGVAGRPRPPAGAPVPGAPHGVSGYTNNRCRCPECRTAWATYNRERRQRIVSAKDGRREETA